MLRSALAIPATTRAMTMPTRVVSCRDVMCGIVWIVWFEIESSWDEWKTGRLPCHSTHGTSLPVRCDVTWRDVFLCFGRFECEIQGTDLGPEVSVDSN